MQIIYSLGVRIYALIIRLAAPFNPKAKQWIDGRKNLFELIEESGVQGQKNAWFHVSSLGEFEQGRPVIEAFRQKYPEYKMVVTFFSPSGYEIRKNYPGADYIFYLPLDTRSNARRFVQLIAPKIVFFIKYEFWFHYLKQLHKQHIPIYIFSAIFRPNQIFFRWYGKWYRQMLTFFRHIFVQNEQSASLLQKFGIKPVTIAGDTRFDRVFDITQHAKALPLIESFAGQAKVIVAGSTWEKDEELLIKYIHSAPEDIKLILAPHEPHQSTIDRIIRSLNVPGLKYSEAENHDLENIRVLVIDSIGLLSSLYRYGCVAYIGGGFGKGIHNTLEAATYRLPVIFGPKFHKFQEAKDLVQLEAGFSILNQQEFDEQLSRLLADDEFRIKSGNRAGDYVDKMRGGTLLILNKIGF